MQNDTEPGAKSGVTIERQEHFDNADRALGLNRRVPPARYREIAFSQPVVADRPVVALPPAAEGYRPELAGKSPDEIAEILARDEATRDDRDSKNLDRLMREHPGGKSTSHSSGSSRRPKRPGPRPDRTKQSVVDAEIPAPYRPHCIAGRVSSHAAAGLKSQGTSVGEMMNELGEALYVGVAWYEIAQILRELAERRRIA